MHFDIPPDLEVLIQKRLDSGAFSSVEDVFRRALEAQEDDEIWTVEEREALDRKIERSMQQFAGGEIYGPEEAREKLDALRTKHLAGRG